VPVPEPPPFAMDQLSARVGAAVAAAAGGGAARGWRALPLRAVAALAAAVLLAVGLWPTGTDAPAPPSSDAPGSVSAAPADVSPKVAPSAEAASAATAAAPAGSFKGEASAAAGASSEPQDDPSFAWIFQLAEAMPEGESAEESNSGWLLGGGLSADAADAAVSGLSADEQQELLRLLKEAMGTSGA
jgi:hypothetical protein